MVTQTDDAGRHVLGFERLIETPRALVWRCWTEPALITRWFTPAPWQTVACTLDLRPGGLFHTVMRSPAGEEFPNAGCILEVVPQQRLTWTNAMAPGFAPLPPETGGAECNRFHFTATIALADAGAQTRYTARVQHADAAGRDRHAAMGFHEGWGAALDQLVALAKTL